MDKRGLPLLLGLLFTIACGSSEPLPSGDPGGAGGSGGSGGSGAGGSGGSGGSSAGSYTVKFDPVTVAPGEERTQCVIKKLGNDTDIHVGKIHNVLPTGSHHLIVYRTEETEEKTTPYDCQPFINALDPMKGGPLMVTQKHDDLLTLPEGVGITLKAGAMVRLEMHYINTSFEDIQVSASSTFETMTDAQYQHEASFLLGGSFNISIPPHSTQTLGPLFITLPPEHAQSKFFGFTGHTHRWGKDVEVSVASGKDDPGTPVYDIENWNWSEPETAYHDPFEVPAGKGFRFSCSWDNQSAETVTFGESANQEMCFFWAYYYPSQGSKLLMGK